MKKLSLLTLALILSTVVSQADQPVPPHVTPIRWILQERHNLNVDDKAVTLVGRVIKKDNGSDWWFSDHTGSIRLDTGDFDLPVGPRLVVRGHIDQSRFGVGYLEVEVDHWHYAK